MALNGHIVKEKLMQLTTNLRKTFFLKNKGWLQCFKDCYAIVFRTRNKESAQVENLVIEEQLKNKENLIKQLKSLKFQMFTMDFLQD